jgi:hypothetical protein
MGWATESCLGDRSLSCLVSHFRLQACTVALVTALAVLGWSFELPYERLRLKLAHQRSHELAVRAWKLLCSQGITVVVLICRHVASICLL